MQTIIKEHDDSGKNIEHMKRKRIIRAIRLKNLHKNKGVESNMKYKKVHWNGKKGKRVSSNNNKDLRIVKSIRRQKWGDKK